MRDLAIKLSELDATYAQTYNAIPDDQLRAFFSRAMSSQKAALIERYRPVLQTHYAELSTPEMVVLGYNVGLSGNADLANTIYETALKAAQAEHNISMEADIYRMQAQLYTSGPQGANVQKLRANYSKAVDALLSYPSPAFHLQASNSAFEWAVFESTSGDWKCGQALGQWAMAVVGALPQASPEVAMYGMQYRTVLARFKPQLGQPQAGCPRGLAAWVDAIAQ